MIGGRPALLPRQPARPSAEWSPDGRRHVARDATPRSRGVRAIAGAGDGAWTEPGSSAVVVGGDGSVAADTTSASGSGEILFLADASPLENDYLATGRQRRVRPRLAGRRAGPVVFAEGVARLRHAPWARRRSRRRGRWRWARARCAALVFVWSRGRRFGPPDRPARELPPARAEYVRALSITLERTRDRAGALAPVQHWDARPRRARAGLRPDADDEADRGGRADARLRRRRGRRDARTRRSTTTRCSRSGRVAARVGSDDGRTSVNELRDRVVARDPQGRRRSGRRRRGAARGDVVGGHSCSKVCPVSPRRCSRTRSRARSASSSAACSSRPTCCRPTSPAR